MNITSCPFGTSGFECSFIIYLIPAILFIGILLFRKNIANDSFNAPFSLIGSVVPGYIAYFIVYAIFHSFKFSLLAFLITSLIGGFLLAELLGDGET